jgi:hypothetical protein
LHTREIVRVRQLFRASDELFGQDRFDQRDLLDCFNRNSNCDSFRRLNLKLGPGVGFKDMMGLWFAGRDALLLFLFLGLFLVFLPWLLL